MPPMVAREAVEMSTGNHKPCGLSRRLRSSSTMPGSTTQRLPATSRSSTRSGGGATADPFGGPVTRGRASAAADTPLPPRYSSCPDAIVQIQAGNRPDRPVRGPFHVPGARVWNAGTDAVDPFIVQGRGSTVTGPARGAVTLLKNSSRSKLGIDRQAPRNQNEPADQLLISRY